MFEPINKIELKKQRIAFEKENGIKSEERKKRVRAPLERINMIASKFGIIFRRVQQRSLHSKKLL